MFIFKHLFNFHTERVKVSNEKIVNHVEVASHKVRVILNKNSGNFKNLCLSVECAENREELKLAFDRLNRIVRVLLVAAPSIEHNWKIVEALRELGCSNKLTYHLNAALTVRQAVNEYKTEVTKDLVGKIRQTEVLARQDDSFDEKLMSNFFPEISSNISTLELYAQKQPGEHIAVTTSPCQKRSISPASFRELSKDTGDFTRKREGSKKRTCDEDTRRRKRIRFSDISPKGGQTHVNSERVPRTCDAFEAGNCRRGKNCNFRHAY